MLENPSLLLLPWSMQAAGQARAPRGRFCRAIWDAETGRPLGFACRRFPRWAVLRAWLAWRALDVYETEDASLLFTLFGPRPFLGGWEVQDADSHFVGTLRGCVVLDRFSRTMATVSRTAEGAGLQFLPPSGHAPSLLVPSNGGSRLTFGPDVVGDPFARMLLLAAALALTDSQGV